MNKRILTSVIAALLLATPGGIAGAAQTPAAPEAQASATPDVPAELQSKLDSYVQGHIRSLSENMLPRENKKDVVKVGTEYVARYLAVDPASVTTEIHLGRSGKQYIGLIVYHELELENHASTREVALSGDFVVTKTKRVTEILRYDGGKWQ